MIAILEASDLIYIGSTTDIDSLLMKIVDIAQGRATLIARLDGGKTEAQEIRERFKYYRHGDVDGWFARHGDILQWALREAANDTSGLLDVGPLVDSSLRSLGDAEGLTNVGYFQKYIEPIIRDRYQEWWQKQRKEKDEKLAAGGGVARTDAMLRSGLPQAEPADEGPDADGGRSDQVTPG